MNSILMQIDFGANGASAPYQTGDWSAPEPQHSWALAPRAGVCLPRPAYEGVIGILVELTPALQPPAIISRVLTIVINRDYRFDCTLFRVEPLLLKLDAAAGHASTIQIDFESPDAPGVEGDDRPLTVALHRLTLIGLGHPAPAPAVRRTRLLPPGDFDATIKAAESAAGAPITSVMASFESLGNACDFGHLQRSLGADFIGLFRFGGVDIRDLVRGIFDRFSRLGDADSIEVRVSSSVTEDYFVVERQYGIGWHTLITPGDASPEQIVAREGWRLPLLKRKFIETIEDAEKIFILRRPEGLMRAQADAVTEALRTISDCKVLWLEQSDSHVGTVEALSDYMMKGTLDVADGLGSSSREAWINVCTNAYLIRQHLAAALR
jgi:hypothetical protein